MQIFNKQLKRFCRLGVCLRNSIKNPKSWILFSGFWDDDKFWIDTAVWND